MNSFFRLTNQSWLPTQEPPLYQKELWLLDEMDLVSNFGSSTYELGDLDRCSPSSSPSVFTFRTGTLASTTQ